MIEVFFDFTNNNKAQVHFCNGSNIDIKTFNLDKDGKELKNTLSQYSRKDVEVHTNIFDQRSIELRDQYCKEIFE